MSSFAWLPFKRRALLAFLPGLCALVVGLGGTLYLLQQLSLAQPVSRWLVGRILLLVLWTILLQASFVAFGHVLLRRVFGLTKLAGAELAVLSMALGFSAFAVLMFVGGALFLFHGTFAILLPLLFLLAGARDAPALWRGLWSAAHGTPASAGNPKSAWSQVATWVATCWGGALIVLLYLQCLSPHSFNFDAIWYHVPVAQDYAREGGIVPFYGDNHRAYPHLTSLLHTWALLVPGIQPLPLRWMLMLHIEFSFVLWRLVGALAAANWLLGKRRVPGLWAVFFLFPSVFIYDQNISGSADHVLGATAVPILLATGRLLQRFEIRWAVLTGIFSGCHMLCKYQSVYLIVAVAGVVSARGLWLFASAGYRTLRSGQSWSPHVSWGRFALACALVVGSAACVSSPHFIKNWVFYQNPIFPLGKSVFPSSFDKAERPEVRVRSLQPETRPASLQKQPTVSPPRGDNRELADAAGKSPPRAAIAQLGPSPTPAKTSATPSYQFHSRSFDFVPQGNGWFERLVWAHKTLLDWPFRTGNRQLTKQRPYMGALFTLLLPLLLFLRPGKRMWLACGVTYLAFLAWGLTNANDRYLLAFLSIPIGITQALLVRAWDLGWLARCGLVPLVLLQFAWGLDAPFHYGNRAIKNATTLINRSYTARDDDQLFDYRRQSQKLTQEFPKDAVVLGRYFKDLMGFDRTTLNTHRNIQKYIPLNRPANVREFWQLARDRGVTHLLYPTGKRKPPWAQDIVLFDALVEVSDNKRTKNGVVIAELSSTAPAATGPLWVLVLGVKEYQDGLYRVRHLSADERDSTKNEKTTKRRFQTSRAEELLEQAGAVLLRGSKLRGAARRALDQDFKRVETFGSLGVYIRK